MAAAKQSALDQDKRKRIIIEGGYSFQNVWNHLQSENFGHVIDEPEKCKKLCINNYIFQLCLPKKKNIFQL